MFLRPNRRSKDGKDHTYWSLVETVRTPGGPTSTDHLLATLPHALLVRA